VDEGEEAGRREQGRVSDASRLCQEQGPEIPALFISSSGDDSCRSMRLIDLIEHAAIGKVNLVSIADFGGWARAQQVHFDDGGVFDQIYQPR
jgi:hypothetical protein